MIYVYLASHRYFFTGIIDTLSEIEILIQLDFVYECFVLFFGEQELEKNEENKKIIRIVYFFKFK